MKSKPRRRHGTAEIELVLSVVVLITLLTLTIGSMRIAIARLDTANSAQFETFRDATSAPDPQYDGGGDLPAIEGVGAVRPGLPSRVHVVEPQVDVEVNTGNRQSMTAVVGGKAGLPGPAWNYAAYPVGSRDREIYGGWFTGYADESHGQLTDPLRLAPPWKP